ncbi:MULTISPECIES: N-acetylglutaminylglutamine synthetase [Pseudomonas]|jgi:GNAT-family acetyltransferase (TIGR03103 family)|uniref:GNAT-family acetyltransferase TIGR03103 n=1 Tax=Pseudomonas putida (strain W619) TaxID=390235 RepID=B1J5J2_PSEPW|nr:MULTISPECIES: N-acetylglutaminylglutamine synthetase [Pseudomonas]MDH1574067.1 N-acetylglutaminylglutamine synthetase [Pseudomonas sp. GD03746]QQE85349.1 N-acetylglutaminylglutamine synthetase [Pseudomonas putida]UTL82422.1 N-acetylglutaminylglutamine synthetase [Pseudomonas putida]HEN8714433.1 N-acetylglutaminylglutamine synthetase [Pseudomonas putida]HEN8719707.1 N-acetylglutaminylglutamine synthetase [Pseudomonas putida]
MKAHETAYGQRLLRGQAPSYERLQARLAGDGSEPHDQPRALHCGWGRLLIGHTYPDPASLAEALQQERPGERDIALYVAAPQQLLAQAPQQLFLDPSDTLRLWFTDYRQAQRVFRGFRIRRAQSASDWQAINTLYQARGMLPVQPDLLTPRHQGGPVYWLAEDEDSGAVIGSVMGLNHSKAFDDPEHGSSLWCLAVDPHCTRPGVGEVLVRHLVEHFMSRGLAYLDLSVLHDNRQAKRLYEKLGFRNLPTFAVKRKNGINQQLFLGPGPEAGLNPYARIIVDEAYRRGIEVQVDDAAGGLFTLSLGGRRVRCRESLSDLTSAVSMTLCQDKRLTQQTLHNAGLLVPVQQLAGNADDNLAFLDDHGAVVVKPVDGEQGQGVAVNLTTYEEVSQAIEHARRFDSRVLLESFHPGHDLRIVVIGFEVVAAAVRHPAQVVGDGKHSVLQLIEAQSRRRQAATGGESRIPLDDETERTLRDAGFDYTSVLPAGQRLAVRRTANLHTGGTLEDVTERLHPVLADAAVRAARALEIPVVGLDLMVRDAEQPDYVIIEANERAGLANHEPQPTAERFVDLLFPHSRALA